MRRYLLITGDQVQSGGDELIDTWKNEQGSWLWADLHDEARDEESILLNQRLGLDLNDIEEAQRPRHPPQFHPDRGHFFLLLKPLSSDVTGMDFSTQQLGIFTADRLLVTRRSGESAFLDSRWATLVADGAHGQGPLDIVEALMGRLTQRYGRILLDLEERLDEIEDILFVDGTEALMEELVGYNTALRKMRRILAYHVSVFGRVKQHMATHAMEKQDEFNGLLELIERYSSLSGLYQDIVKDLIDGYISLNGHHLNQIMKVLTIVTVIFVPLTLLVGVYGMNFEHIPELKAEHGYQILIGVMFAIAAGLMVLFRRMRWL